MALPVVLKSGKNYMTVVLDDSMEFGELLGHIVAKFKEAESFFGDQSFAIMLEGRTLSDREKNIIMDAIAAYTSIKITHLIENDVLKEAIAEKEAYDSLKVTEAKVDNNCLLIDRDVLTGEKIFGSSDVLVLGDVAVGSIIKAGGNIIILGHLFGQALAGNNPKAEKPYIMAYDFLPENFRIGSVLGKAPKKKKKFFGKGKPNSMIARYCDGKISLYNYDIR